MTFAAGWTATSLCGRPEWRPRRIADPRQPELWLVPGQRRDAVHVDWPPGPADLDVWAAVELDDRIVELVRLAAEQPILGWDEIRRAHWYSSWGEGMAGGAGRVFEGRLSPAELSRRLCSFNGRLLSGDGPLIREVGRLQFLQVDRWLLVDVRGRSSEKVRIAAAADPGHPSVLESYGIAEAAFVGAASGTWWTMVGRDPRGSRSAIASPLNFRAAMTLEFRGDRRVSVRTFGDRENLYGYLTLFHPASWVRHSFSAAGMSDSWEARVTMPADPLARAVREIALIAHLWREQWRIAREPRSVRGLVEATWLHRVFPGALIRDPWGRDYEVLDGAEGGGGGSSPAARMASRKPGMTSRACFSSTGD